MSKLNTKSSYQAQTAEGGKAFPHLKPIDALRRSVMSCLLWEDEFYQDGKSIFEQIKAAAEAVSNQELANIAIEARKVMNLRHVPLLLCALLCKKASGDGIVADTISRVISRADELAEFVAIYSHVNGVTPDKVKKKLSAQAKKRIGACL